MRSPDSPKGHHRYLHEEIDRHKLSNDHIKNKDGNIEKRPFGENIPSFHSDGSVPSNMAIGVCPDTQRRTYTIRHRPQTHLSVGADQSQSFRRSRNPASSHRTTSLVTTVGERRQLKKGKATHHTKGAHSQWKEEE